MLKKLLYYYLLFFPAIVIVQAQTYISNITAYGAFETAGINIELSGNDKTETGKAFYKATGDLKYIEGHHFVRYDGNHMASSLFNLIPATTYDVKAVLYNSNGEALDSATTQILTLEEFNIPAPVRIVNVSNTTEFETAIKNMQPGDHILLAPGTYSYQIYLSGKNGTADQPIVIMGANPDSIPLLNQKIAVYKSSYIYFDHLEISTGSKAAQWGLSIRASKHIAVTNCVLHDNGGMYSGNIFIQHSDEIEDQDKFGYHLIMNNLIYDNEGVGTYGHDSIDSVTYFGIKMNYQPGGRTIVRGNTIYGVTDGISSGGDEGKSPVMGLDDNNVLDTWWHQELDIYDNIIYNVRDDCIETDGHTMNLRIFRNRLGACTNSISTAPFYPGPVFIVRNTMAAYHENTSKLNTNVAGETRNVFYYHNTIKQTIETAKSCVYLGEPGKMQKLTWINNIFYGMVRIINSDLYNDNTYRKDLWFDNNLHYTSSSAYYHYKWMVAGAGERIDATDLADFQAKTGQDPNGIEGQAIMDLTPLDSLDTSTGILDLRLLEFSPGIDDGMLIPGINDNYKGNAPDIGALESDYTTGITEPPLAPDSLKTEVLSATKIRLSWRDNSDNESGFVVERSINTGIGFEDVNTLPKNTTMYIDSVLTEATAYTYRIYAFNGLGKSDSTNESFAVTDSINKDGKYFIQDTTAGNNGLIVFEAEHYDAKVNKSGMSFLFTRKPAGFSGHGLIIVKPDTGFKAFGKGKWPADWVEVSPHLDYNIGVLQGGTYYVWIYTNTGGSWTNDSWHVGIDGMRDTTAANLDTHGSNWGWYNTSKWMGGGENATRAYVEIAESGKHVLNIWVREDGAPIDKIWLTNDPNYTPSGLGPDESTRGYIIDNIERIDNKIPRHYELFQNYPNPFNPLTTIKYDIVKSGRVELVIFNVLGQKVATLVNKNQSVGSYNVTFNALHLPSGIYYYRLKTKNFTKVKKMILLK